jgi:hypothetical protein
MGVSVVPGEIRSAAGKMEDAATGVRGNVPTDVSGIADALPGSESAGAAGTLGTTWQTRFRGWAKRVDTHVAGMRSAADDWASTDHTNAARMEKLAREGVL